MGQNQKNKDEIEEKDIVNLPFDDNGVIKLEN